MKKKTTKPKGRFQDRIGKTGSFLVCVFAVIFMLISITGDVYKRQVRQRKCNGISERNNREKEIMQWQKD